MYIFLLSKCEVFHQLNLIINVSHNDVMQEHLHHHLQQTSSINHIHMVFLNTFLRCARWYLHKCMVQ